jgi:hypothetical protein
MTHLTGHDRSQLLLLPEAVDDYVGPDNPVRFIDAFVDGLDLSAASFTGVEPKVTGRPGYAPADLLKLYIHGSVNRVRSSRRLEAETHSNIEVIWLLRHLKPDSKTIADFGATTATPSAVSSVSLCCFVANWICLAGSCSRWMAPGSRRQQQGSQVHVGVPDPVRQSRLRPSDIDSATANSVSTRSGVARLGVPLEAG